VVDATGVNRFSIPIRNSSVGSSASILGCLSSAATTCPGAPLSIIWASVSPYTVSSCGCTRMEPIAIAVTGVFARPLICAATWAVVMQQARLPSL
jgi:hypothetical protein